MTLSKSVACAIVLLLASSTVSAHTNPVRNVLPFLEIWNSTLDTVPFKERYITAPGGNNPNLIDLKDPSSIVKSTEYDPKTGLYIVSEKIGDDYFRAPTYLTFDEYLKYKAKEQEQAYYDKISGFKRDNKVGLDVLDPVSKIDIKNNLVDRLFGGSAIDIRTQGNVDLILGYRYNETKNLQLPRNQQRQYAPLFDMIINMNVTGKIGDKLNLNTQYNNNSSFNFENQFKLKFDPNQFDEDQIIRAIDAGNVTFPLKGQLIQGANSLFGLKLGMQFGRLSILSVAAVQNSKRNNIQLKNGAQVQQFSVTADQYDENRHFFITHYNREHFEDALKNLPQVNTQFGILPNNIEVWVTNDRNEILDTRDIVAIADLGEPVRVVNTQLPATPVISENCNGMTVALPSNRANPIYQQILDKGGRDIDQALIQLKSAPLNLQQVRDFEKVRARKLSPSEYNYDAKLGFVSLNINVRPNQVVGVAFRYKYGDRTEQIGELSRDVPAVDSSVSAITGNLASKTQVLFVKMLKSSTPDTALPMWDLMMKNIYATGAIQAKREEFSLNMYYQAPGGGERRTLGANNIKSKIDRPLIELFGLDQLNVQGDPQADGIFDFVEGVTMNSRTGRIMFPVLEPFGKTLGDQLEPAFAKTVIYDELYRNSITIARERQEKNRFILKGEFKSAVSSEISLGAFNLPKGSVKVSAGGQQLVEGQDFEVDYGIGKVRILNDAFLSSGVPVNVGFEDNSLFGFNQKQMFGTRFDYKFNKNLTMGGTFMRLSERPFTQKVNVGEDPIKNKVYGFDINYSKDAPWLTKFVDKIPGINTKAPSEITFNLEAAYLQPGHPNIVNQAKADKGGVVQLDDFDGNTYSTDLRSNFARWKLSSVPQNDAQNNNTMFPESNLIDNYAGASNRAKLNWYRLADNLGFGVNDETNDEDAKDPYTAIIPQDKIFPNINNGFNNSVSSNMLDFHYQPAERGPYNFDIPNGYPGFSKGITPNGQLKDPKTRFGGVMMALQNTDFETSNVEFVDMWVMSPFIEGSKSILNTNNPGKMVLELGNISEDIMHDSRLFYENGLPGPVQPNQPVVSTDETRLSRIPTVPPATKAFDLNQEVQKKQDVGFDGVDNEAEREKFKEYITKVTGFLTPNALQNVLDDPSNDDYKSFNDPIYAPIKTTPLLTRRSAFNGTEGNSKPAIDYTNRGNNQEPDTEDLDGNNSLDNEGEAYYQYSIPIEPDGAGGMKFNEYVVERLEVQGGNFTDITDKVYFYRVKVPIERFSKNVGNIQSLRSIRFLRMYFTEFEHPIVMRFARMDLSRTQWRRNRIVNIVGNNNIQVQPGKSGASEAFNVYGVDIYQNQSRKPFPYVLPPGIQQEQIQNAVVQNQLQNEGSMAMNILGLNPNAGEAIYKFTNADLRIYKRLRMFAHAEPILRTYNGVPKGEPTKDGDVSLFMRMGSDFVNNYYEYEIPLTMSDSSKLPALFSAADPRVRGEVWKAENSMDINLEVLKRLKEDRNAKNSGGLEIEQKDPENARATMRVRGNPNFAEIKGIMIGVKNIDSLGVAHSVEVWVNELRLNGFDENKGLAAIGRLDLKMADFGKVTISGNYTGIGWGQLEQRVTQRSREEVLQYDATATFEIGKFLPEKSGIRIPFTAQYSNQSKRPEYDPYDKDIKLKDKLSRLSGSARDSAKNEALTKTEIRNISFDNVRKERTNTNPDAKPRPWDIENFSVSYQQGKETYRSPIVAGEERSIYRGQLDYAYSVSKPFTIEPFKKLIKNDKYFNIIKELNLTPLPSSFNFNSNVLRNFNKTTYRFAADDKSTYYNKRFSWERRYDLNWELFKGLRMTYNAQARSVIDEPEGLLDTKVKRDSVWTNVKGLGRTKNFSQNIDANYTLPLKQLPFMDFASVKARVQATYNWDAAALNVQRLGNTIRNTQSRNINGDFNMETLYGKSKYLKRLQEPIFADKVKKKKNKSKGGDDSKEAPAPDFPNNQARPEAPSMEEGGRRKSGLDLVDAFRKNRSTNGSRIIADDEALEYSEEADSTKKKVKKVKEKKPHVPSALEKIIFRPLLMVRKVNLTYDEKYANTVPGFVPVAGLFGQKDFTAPGWDFLLGQQPTDQWLKQAAAKGWLSKDAELNESVVRNFSQTFNARATVEPYNDLRIELTAQRLFDKNHTEDFDQTCEDANFRQRVPRDQGKLTISYFALNTFLSNDMSALYNTFSANRSLVSARLADSKNELQPHLKEMGYRYGYGSAQRDVVIPAFMAAYTGKDVNTQNLDAFTTMPKPNWKVTYAGLSKLPWFKEYFQSVNISHGYTSTFAMSQYFTNDNYLNQGALAIDTTLKTYNYFSRYDYPSVVITESFNPLIRVDMKFKNGISVNAEMKKSRNLSLGFTDNQLTEMNRKEYVIGFSYPMKNVYIPWLDFAKALEPKLTAAKKKIDKKAATDDAAVDPKAKKAKKPKQKGNDLNIKCDFSFADDVTTSYILNQTAGRPLRGEVAIKIAPSMEYIMSKRMSLRAYVNYNQFTPKTSLSFPRTSIDGGVVMSFKLADNK